MNKKIYEKPEVVEIQCSVESGIAASATLWYEETPQGDFFYDVTSDDTWS